jgi:5-methyltetrahydrofolate--homocysteine methyltransferase
MASTKIMERLARGGVVFDGAMGSLLIARGLEAGTPPEVWNRDRADVVGAVHDAYLDAGADVIETNTFGGTPLRLAAHNFPARDVSLNAEGLRIARASVDDRDRVEAGPARCARLVALSVGPTGATLPPVGAATEPQLREAFEAQLEAARGAGSPDLVLIETMYDLREGLAALAAARASFPGVAVGVTLALMRTPRGFFTVMGNEAAAAFERLVAEGADLVGANCSLGSSDMVALAPLARSWTSAPLLLQPNAGQPVARGKSVAYLQSPDDFAADAERIFEAGVNAVGGCCGTTPEFIAQLSQRRRPCTN